MAPLNPEPGGLQHALSPGATVMMEVELVRIDGPAEVTPETDPQSRT